MKEIPQLYKKKEYCCVLGAINVWQYVNLKKTKRKRIFAELCRLKRYGESKMNISDYYDTPLVFAVKHKDMETRLVSRFEGIFTALTDFVLDNNGVVYGCVMTDVYTAQHIRAESREGRDRMRGSKYIQSDIGNILIAVKTDLDQNRHVLFSGILCQITGLRSFLQKKYDILYVCILSATESLVQHFLIDYT